MGAGRLMTGAMVTLLFVGAACGGDDDAVTVGDASDASDAGDAAAPEGEGSDAAATDGAGDDTGVDELVQDLEDQQASQGGGAATLRVGDQEWTFDSVLCAFGEDEIGQEGAEFVLSSIQDGLQMYVSIDSFGHSVSLDDIEDFENPSVSLSASAVEAQLAGVDPEFVQLDGKNVSADTLFFDTESGDLEGTPGTFTATCP